MNVPQRLVQSVEQFRKYQLIYLYQHFIAPLLAEQPELSPAGSDIARCVKIIEQDQAELAAKSLYSELIAAVFASEQLFIPFRNLLSTDQQQLLELLVWDDSITHNHIQERLDLKVTQVLTDVSFNRRIPKDEFSFFPVKEEYDLQYYDKLTFYLPDAVRWKLNTYYTNPRDYYLNTVEQPSTTDFLYANEGKIVQELAEIQLFYQQGKLQTDKSHNPKKGSVNYLQESLELNEFFEHVSNGFRVVRTHLLASALMNVPDLLEDEDDMLALLKELIEAFEYGSFPGKVLLQHLKGGRYIRELKPVQDSLMALLRNMPVGKWIRFENIYNWFRYRNYRIDPVNVYDAEKVLYYTESDGRKQVKLHVSKANFAEVVVRPFWKGSFFLLAALGIVDIAYQHPNRGKAGRAYFSVYDGLQYVRLSDLGGYLVGRLPSFEQQNGQKRALKLSLSDTRLEIYLDGPAELVHLSLQAFAEPLTERIYTVNHHSFLHDCRSLADIQAKEGQFRAVFSGEIPTIWEQFFAEIRAKTGILSNAQHVWMYELPRSRELLRLLASDEELRKWVIRAEGPRVLVRDQHHEAFKSRMRELGYVGI